MSRFAGKTFRVCISKKIKTARREGRAVLVDLYAMVQHRVALIPSSSKRFPNLLVRSGCGRRERGDANGLNILGWIVLRLQNVSIAICYFVMAFANTHPISFTC